MRHIPRPRLAILAAALALVGTTLTAVGWHPPARVAAVASPTPAGVREPATTRDPPRPGLAPSHPPVRLDPVRLDIPRIGVHTGLIRLGLHPDGTVEVPPLRSDAPAGWYGNSAIPGETGAAVLLGHVDSARDGPAVFHRLDELRPGDRISVFRADGSTARFLVTDVARYPKSSFPTSLVYGPTAYPALRLVTCGGSFDRVHRSYRDNVIVSAR